MKDRLFWLLYNLLFPVAFLVMLPRWFFHMYKRGGYARNFLQRIGCYKPEIRRRLREGNWIWIQAVSVGEVFVANRFIEEMQRVMPDLRFVLSTNTSTGYRIAEKQLDERNQLIYFPLDFPWVMRKVFRIIRPQALLLVECELWPNLVRTAHRRGIPKILINGRISDSSFEGYRKARFFARRVLRYVDLLCVQGETDGQRLKELGAYEDRVCVMGSAKYQGVQDDPDAVARSRAVLRKAGLEPSARILLGGSTWPGEERELMEAYRELKADISDLVLVLAPRHVERTPELLEEIHAAGLSVVRRSELDESSTHADRPDILLVDTTGELVSFYPHAEVIFVGKSLCEHGGQNIIEPAFFSKPVVVGPNMENFPVIIRDFREAHAIAQVSDAHDLRKALRLLLKDPAKAGEIGHRAGELVASKAGAITETIERIRPLLVV